MWKQRRSRKECSFAIPYLFNRYLIGIGRVEERDIKWEGKDTKTFRGDTGLGHWINHTSDSSDQRCCEPHVCQTGSLLCLLWGRQGSCRVAADATVNIQGWIPALGLWGGRTLVAGSSAQAACWRTACVVCLSFCLLGISLSSPRSRKGRLPPRLDSRPIRCWCSHLCLCGFPHIATLTML